MGYTITIGNAVLVDYGDAPDDWDGQYVARFEVKLETHSEAPAFPGDEMTGQSNQRSPSYSAWEDTMREAGLGGLFHPPGTEPETRNYFAFPEHPGCQAITPAMLATVSAAIARRQEVSSKPPGFMGRKWQPGDPGPYDACLARLLWLEWWMAWALKNCVRPAIQNS